MHFVRNQSTKSLNMTTTRIKFIQGFRQTEMTNKF